MDTRVPSVILGSRKQAVRLRGRFVCIYHPAFYVYVVGCLYCGRLYKNGEEKNINYSLICVSNHEVVFKKVPYEV